MLLQTVGASTTLLIDGSNLIHRAYWAGKQQPLVNGKGVDVTCTFIGLKMVRAYAEQFAASNIYVAWDKRLVHGVLNFRQQTLCGRLDEDGTGSLHYKGTRDKTHNDEIHTQEEDLRAALRTLGVRNMYPRLLEADDVIAWLTTMVVGPKVIVTNDKDLLQLVDEQTSWYNGTKKLMVNLDNFEQLIGVPKTAYLGYKALIGDSSDNIFGVIADDNKAKELAVQGCKTGYITLKDGLASHYELNKKLMDLAIGYKESPGEEDAYQEQFTTAQFVQTDFDTFRKMCETLEFNSILKDFDKWKRSFE